MISSLERERVTYADWWIKELNDFRHVRIAFTEGEAKDYARRIWAYELFLRAGTPKWARETPDIDADVAKDADTYSPELKDGRRIKRPYLCFSAFRGAHLDAIECDRAPRRMTSVDLHVRH